MSKRIVWSLPNSSRWNRAASAPTSSISSSSDTNVPARLLIGTGSPPRRKETHWWITISTAPGSKPRACAAPDARDVAVVIRPPDVDQVIEPAIELVDQVRAIGAEVRVPAVAPYEHTVLVVAERRRTEPDGALGLIGVSRGTQLVDRLRDLTLAIERRLGDVGVEPDVETRERCVDPAQDSGGGSTTHRGQPFFIRERRPSGFLDREL